MELCVCEDPLSCHEIELAAAFSFQQQLDDLILESDQAYTEKL